MGAMSDLHLLAMEVLEREKTIEQQVEDSTYPREEIEYAVEKLRQA